MNAHTQPDKTTFLTCYAELAGDMLIIGNALIERRWRVDNGLLYAVSLLDRQSGVEWIGEAASIPAPVPATALPQEPRAVTFTAEGGAFGPTEEPSLRAELVAAGASGTLRCRFQIFPASAAWHRCLMRDRYPTMLISKRAACTR